MFDYKGKEIYAGDIVRKIKSDGTFFKDIKANYYEVRWHEEYASFENVWEHKKLVVVSNIYEYYDLLVN